MSLAKLEYKKKQGISLYDKIKLFFILYLYFFKLRFRDRHIDEK